MNLIVSKGAKMPFGFFGTLMYIVFKKWEMILYSFSKLLYSVTGFNCTRYESLEDRVLIFLGWGLWRMCVISKSKYSMGQPLLTKEGKWAFLIYKVLK